MNTSTHILGETITTKFKKEWSIAEYKYNGFKLIEKLVSENNLEPKEKAAIAIALGCLPVDAWEELIPS